MPTILRLLLIAACGFAGFLLGKPGPPIAAQAPPPVAPKESRGLDRIVPATATESTLIAEWEQLRAQKPESSGELSDLYTQIKLISDPFRRRAFRSALLAEWSKSNPQAALAYLSEKDSSMVTQLLREWLRIDPTAALNAALAGNEKQRSALRSILNDIVRMAPERLAQVVSALPKSQSRWDTTATDAFALLAKKDPDAARQAAESITGPLRGQALAGIGKTWGEQDGAAALKWAQAMSAGDDRDGVLKAVLIGWAKSDPVAALNKIDLVPPGGEEGYYNSDVGAQVLREAGRKDWEGTLSWLKDHPGKLGRSSIEGLQDVLSRRLTSNASGTLDSLNKSGVAGIEGVLANSLLNDGYVAKDQIWKWLDEQPANNQTRSIRSSVLNAIGWKEPMMALSYLDKIPNEGEDRQVLENGVRSLINGGSQMALFEDLMAAASDKIRPYLLISGFEYGMRDSLTDPERWIKRIDELPTERRDQATAALARGWAANDPAAAVNWTLSLPEGPAREVAFSAATDAWASSDTYEASKWVESLPAGDKRDSATAGLVRALTTSQPETAWQWALNISSNEKRVEALRMAYVGLQMKDPAIAKQMLQSAQLPPGQAEAIFKLNAR